MKILFIHRIPCIRNWKLANVLHDLGHEVYLAEMVNSIPEYYTLPTDCYRERFALGTVVGLERIAGYFDLIHCHNEPDFWTVFALSVTKGRDIRIIHDCHDWVPGRQAVTHDYLANAYIANTFSDLVVYVSEVQREQVRLNVGDYQSESIVVRNFPLEKCIPKELKPKIKSDVASIVYAGGISSDQNSHRWFVPEFFEFLKAGFDVYCYAPHPEPVHQKILGQFGNWHWMGHCPYTELMSELSQYDFGILPFNKNSANAVHLDTGLPNKLFEYVSAGLPVLCKSGFEQQEKFINEHGIGYIYEDIGDAINKMRKNEIELDRFKWTFDKEVRDYLIPHYEKFNRGNTYTKVKPKKLLEKKGYSIEMEIFTDGETETGLYGVGHDKDLVYESYLIEEGMLKNEKEEE